MAWISVPCSSLLDLDTGVPGRHGTFDLVLHPFPPRNQCNTDLPTEEHALPVSFWRLESTQLDPGSPQMHNAHALSGTFERNVFLASY